MIAFIRFLWTEDEEKLITPRIEDELADLRTAYKDLLDEMRKVSTQLAFADYQKVEQYVSEFKHHS